MIITTQFGQNIDSSNIQTYASDPQIGNIYIGQFFEESVVAGHYKSQSRTSEVFNEMMNHVEDGIDYVMPAEEETNE